MKIIIYGRNTVHQSTQKPWLVGFPHSARFTNTLCGIGSREDEDEWLTKEKIRRIAGGPFYLYVTCKNCQKIIKSRKLNLISGRE